MSAAAEWHRLDDAYYRRTTLYDLAWPVQSLRDELCLLYTSDAADE